MTVEGYSPVSRILMNTVRIGMVYYILLYYSIKTVLYSKVLFVTRGCQGASWQFCL